MKRIETRFEMLADQPNKLWDTRYMRPYDVPFYHGTASILLPGQTINADYDVIRDERSNHPLHWGEETGEEGGYAFATTNIETAQKYAIWRAKENFGVGFIYQVEPLNWDYHYDPWDSRQKKDRGDQGGAESFRSPTGWRVIKLVQTEWVSPDPPSFISQDISELREALQEGGPQYVKQLEDAGFPSTIWKE